MRVSVFQHSVLVSLLNFFVLNSSINQAVFAVILVLLLSHSAAFDSSENA